MSRGRSRSRLASPTMAQIYLRQGHYHRARETIAALLRDDPTCGAALLLQRRLALIDGPTLRSRLTADHTLELRWTAAPPGSAVLLTLFSGFSGFSRFSGSTVYVTSRTCSETDGRWRLDLEPLVDGRPAIAAALVQPTTTGEARPLAVAAPIV